MVENFRILLNIDILELYLKYLVFKSYKTLSKHQEIATIKMQ